MNNTLSASEKKCATISALQPDNTYNVRYFQYSPSHGRYVLVEETRYSANSYNKESLINYVMDDGFEYRPDPS